MREGFSFGEDSREAGDGVGRVDVTEGILPEWLDVEVVVWVEGAVVVILGWLWSNGGSGSLISSYSNLRNDLAYQESQRWRNPGSDSRDYWRDARSVRFQNRANSPGPSSRCRPPLLYCLSGSRSSSRYRGIDRSLMTRGPQGTSTGGG